MSKHDPNIDKRISTDFGAVSLADDPHVMALVLHLAYLAAKYDWNVFSATGEIPYSSPEPSEGRP